MAQNDSFTQEGDVYVIQGKSTHMFSGGEVTNVSVLKGLYASVCACLHLLLQYGHCSGQRVKLCDMGRCQVMTKHRSSGRSDELWEMEAVMVVMMVVVTVMPPP